MNSLATPREATTPAPHAGRPRQTAARIMADRRRNRNLNLHALVLDLARDDPDLEVQAWCELGRPLLRARQRRLERAWQCCGEVV